MLWFRRRPKLDLKTIDPEEQETILELHRQHPELGRKRLHALLKDHHIDVGAHELKLFLRANKIGTPPPIRQQENPWRRVIWHPWLRYRP
jgi:hypothetical protein